MEMEMEMEMDSVEYSGIRQYLLSQGTRDSRVGRELWSFNEISYPTFRKYLNHVREFGFPEEQDLSSPSLAVSQRRPSSEPSVASTTYTHHKKASSLPAIYAFAGVGHILDACQVPITTMSYGHLSSEILAYGSADGNVWVAFLHKSSEVKKLSGGHTKEVMDLTWSLDNSLLMTCGMEGNVCLWDPDQDTYSRKLTLEQPAYSCRFHPLNQNLLLVAVGGDIVAFNGSTGSQVLKHTVIPSNLGDCITAMTCSNTFTFVGDRGGTLHMLKCEHKPGVHMAFSPCYHASHPHGKKCAVSGIQHLGYSVITKGPALLVTYTDSTVGIYKVHDTKKTCWPELAVKCSMPPAARRINAVWCPPSSSTEVESIAMGGEDKNVHIYDITRLKGSPVVVNELQAHSAPVVTICWSFNEAGLASGDCNGMVIVWRKDS